jgi:thiol:disulfide interchange protein DsbC
MMKSLVVLALGISLVLPLWASDASAFQKEGCGMGECRDCHTLTPKEVSGILGNLVDNVLKVEASPVQGLWVVDIAKQGKKFPIYIDFSKKFLISGQVVRLSTKEDITGTRYENLNAVTVNPAEIPLKDTLLVGSPDAKKMVIVFSDPDCHFCGKLHQEMKTAVAIDPGVAFYIKIYSRNNNPSSVEKAKAVICSQSLSMMEDAYAGKKLPSPTCTTNAVEETFKLAEKLNIRGTPALVLPNGKVVSGYRPADVLLQLLSEGKPGTAAGGKSGTGEKKPGEKK